MILLVQIILRQENYLIEASPFHIKYFRREVANWLVQEVSVYLGLVKLWETSK